MYPSMVSGSSFFYFSCYHNILLLVLIIRIPLNSSMLLLNPNFFPLPASFFFYFLSLISMLTSISLLLLLTFLCIFVSPFVIFSKFSCLTLTSYWSVWVRTMLLVRCFEFDGSLNICAIYSNFSCCGSPPHMKFWHSSLHWINQFYFLIHMIISLLI